MEKQRIFICIFVMLIITAMINARPQEVRFQDEPDPSWMRRQLVRMGETASNIGNKMGGFAVRLSATVDRLCAVIKKIIPIVGAVCTVGKFKFCALDNTTGDFPPDSEFSSPIAGPGLSRPIGAPGIVNLDELDR